MSSTPYYSDDTVTIFHDPAPRIGRYRACAECAMSGARHATFCPYFAGPVVVEVPDDVLLDRSPHGDD